MVLIGQSLNASNVITFRDINATDDLLVGMEITVMGPDAVFPVGTTINSIISGSQVEVSAVATDTSTIHNQFTFKLPVGVADQFLPPTTANSAFTANQCSSFRDPALQGDYIQVRNLVSVKANPGYNSPTDLADQLTQAIQQGHISGEKHSLLKPKRRHIRFIIVRPPLIIRRPLTPNG